MKKLSCIPLLLVFFSGLAFGQSKAPTCNAFDTTGAPVYFNGVTNNPNCTDYFGAGNWANSPLPAGTITGFTLIAGGSGYVNPLVVITDLANPTGTCAATATQTLGIVTAFSAPSGVCSGYVMPQVTIVDVGTLGSLAAPTCGGAGQPVCGTGALATAVVGGPYTGGMLKFQDPLKDLKTVIATADTTKFPGSDYYEIALVQYTQKLHSSLPATTLRGYEQLPAGSTGCSATPVSPPSYLGPVILAQKNKPVRVKFTNCLPTGSGGNLFIPTDTTYMGAGMGPDSTAYTQNRATLHLHGGATPWISDGTPHQWTVPPGEVTTHQRGDSTAFVPDMWFDATTHALVPAGTAGATNDPGLGSMTFYWTNQQGGRLMFYHDHAYGITRLNVYAGEAAGYLLVDPAEEDALAAATVPGTIGTAPDLAHVIPLVIQDKSFVPSAAQLAAQDPTWAGNYGVTALSATGSNGDLWFPHVYMPNQNPADPTGGNAFGRWDYGAWFFPPQTSLTAATPPTAVTVACTSTAFPGQTLMPTTACPTCGCPITPNPSGTPEAFGDTPVVNGVAYPVLHVAPEAYRFQMLAAGNDRSWHLSWFVADPANKTEVAMIPAVPPSATSVFPALGSLPSTPLTLCPAINPVAVPSLIIGLDTGLLDASGNPLNGTGLWGTTSAPCWPSYGHSVANVPPIQQTMWAADGRLGGVPDPRTAGPAWVQIGTEGGLLPAPVVIPATPVNYELNTKSITITSVGVHGLWLGPAERADVIVDFSKATTICSALGVIPCTLILYNDAPAPAPAIDTRLDYFTGDGDSSPIGGAPNTPPGYGPNTRTVMQVIVDAPTTGQAAFSLPALQAALPALFKSTQPAIIVPEPTYPVASGGNSATQSYATIQANSLTYTPTYTQVTEPCSPPAAGCVNLDQKAIQELFTLDYGRMNATLGTEIPLTNFLTQTTIPYGYAEWATEIIQDGDTQLWKITHNGVDTHFIHFHLFNVQVVNRMGWDGSTRPPDANELGWKDTVRMNPLEDILVALQPITPTFPFPLPDSIRALDVTVPTGVVSPAISGIDPGTGNAITAPGGTTNALVNFGWEYVWHCHILGHEENDMMRPIIHQVAPPAPSNLQATAPTATTLGVMLAWTDNSASETLFTVQRDTVPGFSSTALTSFTVNATSANTTGFNALGYGQGVTFLDTTAVAGSTYFYRMQATDSFTQKSPLAAPFQTVPMSSAWVLFPPVNATLLTPTVTFTGAPATAVYGTSFVVTATTNSSSMPTIAGTAGVCTVGTPSGTAASAKATVTISGTGTCTLTANWAQDAFFLAATATQTTTATPAALTITASSGTMVYRGTVPAITPIYSAFVSPDTAANAFTTPPTCSTTATSTSPVGSYPSTCSGAVAANYTITYVPGTVTVTAVPLTITANNAIKAYGVALTFLGTEFTATGLLTGDTITSVTLTSAGAAATAAVASYPIVPSAAVGTGLTNYTITYVNGTLSVTPVALTITANAQSKFYGQTLTFLGTEFTATGLLNGNTVTSVTLTSSGAAATAAVGSYPIVPSAAVGTGLANYTISYVNGTLTVNKASTLTTITSAVPNPSIRGQIVTVSFSVAPQFTGTPSGNVTVTASTGETCTATLAAGAGSCNLTFLTGGTRTVTAAYPGDANFLTSTSAPVTQIVSAVDLSTKALLFGNQILNTTSAAQTVTLTNVGTTALAMTSITIAGDFAQTNNCPLGGTLRAGRSCSINVRFTPTALGLRTGALTINDVDPSTPQTVSLTGTGVQPAAVLSAASLTFGPIARRASQTLPITLSNPGTAPLTIAGISIGGVNAAQFSQTNNCGASLAIGATCTINVTFSSRTAGTFNATLNVSDNAPGSPQSAILTGTAQ